MKMNLLVVISGVLLLLIQGCATVPMTDRTQLRLLPDSELVRMSMDSYQEVLGQSRLSTDSAEVEPVRRVGQRLASAAERYLTERGLSTRNYQWEFNVIKDDAVANAWCMPGGKVAVYTGIFPYTQDDNGLAVVMSHEIAHAIANHGNERMSQAMLTQLGEVALSSAMRNQPSRTKELFQLSYGVASQVGVLLPYSRLHESEADRIGLTLMAMAGYDPRAAVPFWQRMGEADGGRRPPELLSTHPAPRSRIENIERFLPEALEHYQPR